MTSYSLIYLAWGLRKHNNDHSYPFFDHCEINMATQSDAGGADSWLQSEEKVIQSFLRGESRRFREG